MKVYISLIDPLPNLFVKANSKKEAKDKVYKFYKEMNEELLKKHISIYTPEEILGNNEIEEIPLC